MTGIHKIMTNELPLGVTNTMQTRAASWLLAQMHTPSCHTKCCYVIDVASMVGAQYHMVTKGTWCNDSHHLCLWVSVLFIIPSFCIMINSVLSLTRILPRWCLSLNPPVSLSKIIKCKTSLGTKTVNNNFNDLCGSINCIVHCEITKLYASYAIN